MRIAYLRHLNLSFWRRILRGLLRSRFRALKILTTTKAVFVGFKRIDIHTRTPQTRRPTLARFFD